MEEMLKKIYIFFFIIRYRWNSVFIKEKKNCILFIEEFPYTLDVLKQRYPNTTYIKLSLNKTDKLKIKIKYMCQAKYIYTDNYNVLMPYINKKKIKIQVWHAAIALKKIGFDDQNVKKASKSSKKRYQKVYNAYNYYISPSKQLTEVFTNSFNVEPKKILELGYTKLDYYKSPIYKKNIQKYQNESSHLLEKLNILYIPTFRNNKEENKQHQLINNLYEDFNEDFNIFYKLHKNTNATFRTKATEVKEGQLENLLEFVDIVITDYSSIVIEALMKNKAIIYYLYDYNEYKQERGLNVDYKNLPGQKVYEYNKLKQVINNKQYIKNTINELDSKYIPYNLLKENSEVSINILKHLHK